MIRKVEVFGLLSLAALAFIFATSNVQAGTNGAEPPATESPTDAKTSTSDIDNLAAATRARDHSMFVQAWANTNLSHTDILKLQETWQTEAWRVQTERNVAKTIQALDQLKQQLATYKVRNQPVPKKLLDDAEDANRKYQAALSASRADQLQQIGDWIDTEEKRASRRERELGLQLGKTLVTRADGEAPAGQKERIDLSHIDVPGDKELEVVVPIQPTIQPSKKRTKATRAGSAR